jgi:ribosomal-protein-alanine N-acetyltransferase
MIVIRPAHSGDCERIAAIQKASPEGAQWQPGAYLAFECTAAEVAGHLAGFLAVRRTAPGEAEILNLAVAPEYRRQGVARALLEEFLNNHRGECFLEVRASNRAALALYQSFRFERVGLRPNYYSHPPESAIVMRRLS